MTRFTAVALLVWAQKIYWNPLFVAGRISGAVDQELESLLEDVVGPELGKGCESCETASGGEGEYYCRPLIPGILSISACIDPILEFPIIGGKCGC